MEKMNTAKVKAYAKVNLTLDITGEADGFHTLDSLVVTVDLFDQISAKKRKDGKIRVFMHGLGSETIPPEENNAQRAGEAFTARFKTAGADIAIYKNIPVGAGMGGSSADAAGVVNAMAALYGVTDSAALKELADSLGSDTGYLLKGGFARMRGRGERIEPIADMPPLDFFLLIPQTGVNTAECFRTYDGLRADAAGETRRNADMPRTERVLESLRSGAVEWAARVMGNGLFEAAKRLNPDVEKAYLSLKEFSPLGTFMTGSGSGCCALFATRELCEWAKSRYKGKFRAYVLRSVEPKRLKPFRNPFALGKGEGE